MSSSPMPEVSMRDMRWSQTEKAAARRAFDLARSREKDAIIREAKERAARITDVSQLWELEYWIRERRRDMDEKFDYRYSALPVVFARLLHEGRLSEGDLQGLGRDKSDYIRRIASLW